MMDVDMVGPRDTTGVGGSAAAAAAATKRSEVEKLLSSVIKPSLGRAGDEDLDQVIELCLSGRFNEGFYSLSMGCGGAVVMRVPVSGRRAVTGTLSELPESFAELDLDIIRREVPACLRNPRVLGGLPAQGEIISPRDGQVIAQVRSTRIPDLKPMSFTTIPSDFLDIYTVGKGHDVIFIDAGRSRYTKQCSIDQSRRWVTGVLASQGSYYSAMHLDMLHYPKKAAVMVVEDNAFAAKLWCFGRAGATAQVHNRDTENDDVGQMRRLLREAVSMFNSGHGATKAEYAFCLQLPNQAVSFEAAVPHAVFNLGNPEGKMCVNVGIYDYKRVTPYNVASYMSSMGAGESQGERDASLKQLGEKRGRGFLAEVNNLRDNKVAGQEQRLETVEAKKEARRKRAKNAAEARYGAK